MFHLYISVDNSWNAGSAGKAPPAGRGARETLFMYSTYFESSNVIGILIM
jgi:hypothetical protein